MTLVHTDFSLTKKNVLAKDQVYTIEALVLFHLLLKRPAL